MALSGFRKFVFCIGLVLLAAGCMREQPVYNVVDHPITVTGKKVTLATVQKAIMKVGLEREWIFTPVSPGHLKGALNQRGSSANIDVKFSTKAYSISYVSSANLLATGEGTIHRNYNKWIKILERDIDLELAKLNM